ncbi:Os09g0392600 [Oryza sativa Japonica Group]|jgi:hypothetical protein|uniref:Uncharacterized protein n=3 Tax=Oryza TaxID=4527 RepID=A0A8J8XBA5_ORYSJ|nr:hypothetical protein OsJ_29242 [Oryza sativa Japonica Group]BAT07911.1 Os09g0392600 [Oryza sativa Japonica Group]
MAKTTRAWKAQAASDRKDKAGQKAAEDSFQCSCGRFYKGSTTRENEHTQRCLAKRKEVAAGRMAAEAAKEAANEP